MDDWQVRLANFLTQGDVTALTKALILLGALTACSLYGLIQFLTMLMTRWGDRNPAPKAFILSVLLHVTLIMAWYMGEIIWPSFYTKNLPANIAAATSIPIREIVEKEVEDPFEQGETPVWQKLNELPDLEKSRDERASEEPEEMAEAPRMASESATPAIDPTELTDVPSEVPTAAAAPNQEPSPNEMKIKASAVPVETAADSAPTTEARADAGTRAPARSTQRTTKAVEIVEEVPKTRGSADLKSPPRPDDAAMSIPLETAKEDDASPVLDGQRTNTIRKGAAPTPSSAPDGEFIAGGRTDSDSKATTTKTRKFDRTKSRRTSDSEGDSPLPDRIPGEGRPVASLSPEAMRTPSKTPGDLTGVSPTPSLAPATGPNLPNRSPAAYKLRKLEQRRGAALKQGGSLESERAVENSLRWLAKIQEPDGFWDTDKYGGGAVQKDPHGYDRGGGGTFADSGITGLALLAFMGAGYTQDDGEYADNVTRGLKWLIEQQRGDGYLGGNAAYFDQMYCHAIATIALAEACGMQDEADRSPELRRAIRLAVEFIVERQGSDGGWRYKKEQPGDMSMFGWQLMALKSADIAGVKAKPETWNAMIEFLKKRGLGEHSGLAAYNQSQSVPTAAMTAEALFCKQMIGIRRTNPACQEAVAYIRKHLPRLTAYDEYYWYYGTMSMFQHGGEAWEEWNQVTRDLIVRMQLTSGKFAGSWEPRGKWAGNGGRIYSTAISTLCLEVYYRYLPLYQSTQE